MQTLSTELFAYESLRFLYYYDPYTYFHSIRVGMFSLFLACELGLEDPRGVSIVGLLHDLGKIRVPKDVLCKPGPLTERELLEIRRHPRHGGELLERYDASGEIVAGVRGHHESFDGSGYPDGLAGAAIPLAARIVAIADYFDATVGIRTYRDSETYESFEALLDAETGRKFDPEIVDLFRRSAGNEWVETARMAADLFGDDSLKERIRSVFGGRRSFEPLGEEGKENIGGEPRGKRGHSVLADSVLRDP